MASVDADHRGLLKLSVLHMLEAYGIERAEEKAIDFCVDFVEKYLISLGRKAKTAAELEGRGWITCSDLRTTLETSMPCGPRSAAAMAEAMKRYGQHWTGADTFGQGDNSQAGGAARRAHERRTYAQIIACATRDAPRLITGAPLVPSISGPAAATALGSRPDLVDVESKFSEMPTYYPPHLPPMPPSHAYMETVAQLGAASTAQTGLLGSAGATQAARLAILENASAQGARTLSSLRDLVRLEEEAAREAADGSPSIRDQDGTASSNEESKSAKRARTDSSAALIGAGTAAKGSVKDEFDGEATDNPFLAGPPQARGAGT